MFKYDFKGNIMWGGKGLCRKKETKDLLERRAALGKSVGVEFLLKISVKRKEGVKRPKGITGRNILVKKFTRVIWRALPGRKFKNKKKRLLGPLVPAPGT